MSGFPSNKCRADSSFPVLPSIFVCRRESLFGTGSGKLSSRYPKSPALLIREQEDLCLKVQLHNTLISFDYLYDKTA